MEDLSFPDLDQAEVLPELAQITQDEKYGLIGLLSKTTLEERQQKFLEMEINNCEQVEEFKRLYQSIIPNLIEDKDRISMGFPYGATDIKKALQNLR